MILNDIDSGVLTAKKCFCINRKADGSEWSQRSGRNSSASAPYILWSLWTTYAEVLTLVPAGSLYPLIVRPSRGTIRSKGRLLVGASLIASLITA